VKQGYETSDNKETQANPSNNSEHPHVWANYN
jgi:hypothetical protein